MQWSDTSGNTGILQEIQRALKQNASSLHWADTDFLRRTNIVMRNICEESECLKTISTSTTSVAGTAEYDKPSGCSRIMRVLYGYDRVFGVLEGEIDMVYYKENSHWQELTGTPTRYIDRASTILFIPIPTATGDTITIEYIQQPTELSAITDIPFNSRTDLYSFHDLIVSGVVYRCLLEDANPAKIDFMRQWRDEFNAGKKRLKDFVKNRPDILMTMVDTRKEGLGNTSPLPGFWKNL